MLPLWSLGQSASNLRNKKILLNTDTVRIDTLSIDASSFKINGEITDTSAYQFLPLQGIFVKKNKNTPPKNDSISITYRVFPLNFSTVYRNKARSYSTAEQRGIFNPFVFTPSKNNENLLKFDGLNKSGSISRGLSLGNNQDLSVNSTLNLQLSGKLSQDIDISAAITDDNIPIQPDGNTQQLQDFDRVYIQLNNEKSKLIVGDFQITRPESYFMNFNKRLQGGSFTTVQKVRILPNANKPLATIKGGASAAVARGRFNRNQIQGIEGNQGPYRLRGTNNEQFIIILSGSEKVYIDGRLLKRGQENDYIIDYNSAEVIFTSRTLITKDLRIFVEFEYSDRNYARSLLYFNNELEQGKFSYKLNVYSEQDSRSQPLQQKLTQNQKDVLINAGDNLSNALIDAVDTVAFSKDLILYQRKDTVVNNVLYPNILVYSTNDTLAIYKATFTSVGAKKGNYIQANSAANGRVFQWVAPIDGIPQGSFEPKIQLIPATKKQIATLGTEYKFSKKFKMISEVAYSKLDLNTFSPLDDGNDQGYAFRIAADHTLDFGKDSMPWRLVTTASYEQIDKNFSPIERFRNVEFDRDWNLQKVINQPASEYIPRLNLNLRRNDIGTVNYLFTAFNKGAALNANQHSLTTDVKRFGFGLNYIGSYTQSKGDVSNTKFYRHKTIFTKNIRWFQLGYKDEFEQNLLSDAQQDTLKIGAYRFFDRQVFLQNIDTAKRKFNLFYRVRTDDGLSNHTLKQYAWAENYGFTLDLSTNENIQFRSITSYRRLKIRDSLLTSQKPEQTLVNRFELSIRALKNSISSTTYFEVGSGLETRKQFSYLEVQPGQGVYSWNDYNNNGIKELNEFEVAAFPDQARYIRVFTPTTDFIRVYSNQFNQVLNLKAQQSWSKGKKFLKFLSRLSTQSAYRVDGRTTNQNVLEAYNPFANGINDNALITLNQSVRNTFFFNRTATKFGFDINQQQVGSKALLNNGLESRNNSFYNLRLRWSPGSKFTFNVETKNGKKSSTVQFFNGRDFSIQYVEIEPKISYQPSATFRLTLSYKNSEKQNAAALGNQKTTSNKAGIDLKYNVAAKGSFQANFNLIVIQYNGQENTPIAFEMLEGLRTGQNLTWGLSYQRTLSNNMQINVNYDGRKSPNVKTIHVGGVQVRVFF